MTRRARFTIPVPVEVLERATHGTEVLAWVLNVWRFDLAADGLVLVEDPALDPQIEVAIASQGRGRDQLVSVSSWVRRADVVRWCPHDVADVVGRWPGVLLVSCVACDLVELLEAETAEVRAWPDTVVRTLELWPGLQLVAGGAVVLRGDTDFSQTEHLDRWHNLPWVRFVFGYDARPNLIQMAEELPAATWQPLRRPPRYQVKTQPRQRPDAVLLAVHVPA